MAISEKNTKKEKKMKKSFSKEFRAELKKVTWPTPKQLVNNTVAVITIVLIITAIVFVLDSAFDVMNKYGINKAQSFVQDKVNSSKSATDENATESNEGTIIENQEAPEVEAAGQEEAETE